MTSDRQCRFCQSRSLETFADLGMSPLANSFIDPAQIHQMESFYPLHAYVCADCHLVQLEQFAGPEKIFDNYLYFSSFSDAWLRHAESYTCQTIERFGLNSASQIVEVASNDGYLLQYFQAHGIPVLGIEPARNVARVAIDSGIPTDIAFFNTTTAERLRDCRVAADLIVANNVLAHVPDINDFVAGFRVLLKKDGVLTLEFPHLLRLIAENQFDTIYHEHFSYLSLHVVQRVLSRHGLRVFDVQQLATHGGSLRVFACRAENMTHVEQPAVAALRRLEATAGLEGMEVYRRFARQTLDTKCAILEFLISARRAGKRILGYGAPAKGNTLLNYCGIRTDFIEFTVDRSPHKQGLFLPGSRIPIRQPEDLVRARPDYVLVLPWNWKSEIIEQMSEIRSWGGKFVIPVPEVELL